MDGPGHGSGTWRDTTPCAFCGSSVPATAKRCPQCGRERLDDALTILGETPLPTPAPQSEGSADDATRVVAAPDSPDDVTRVVAAPADAADDVTRFVAPTDASEEATRFAPPEDALTIAVSDSAADARTMAGAATSRSAARLGRRTSGDTGPLEVGQSFGPRYHIIRLLGAGGMGAVYQAWDAELGVAVAIKVIRPEVMEDPATAEEVGRRFKRELLLARQVTHKNVVRIHDIGDIDGIKYITMSYVEGTDLATVIKKDGRRSIPELLHIARAVISGLVAAHSAGVVHRDLKPANIMIGKDGEALIMDFGIAHSTGDTGAGPQPGAGVVPEHLTRNATHHAATTLGSIVGTVEYMAPEQARGEAIDQRVDVYAFGLILYDTLLGRRRIASGAAAVEELQRRLKAPPPPLQALESDLPAPLAALVGRCVEPDPAKRFQTSAEVAAELDRLDDQGQLIPIKKTIGLPQMAAIVALLTAVFGGAWWYFREEVPVTHENIKVLVADLDNQTGDPQFDHALEPVLKRALDGASFIQSYDRSRLPSLGEKPPDRFDEKTARDVAVRQGMQVLLSGVIAKRGSTGYDISLKATQVVTSETLATERDTASGTEDVTKVVTQLVARVREALGDDTSESSKQFGMGSITATSFDVVRLYAASLEAASNGNHEESYNKALEAVKRDPNFGIGYLALASASRNRGNPADGAKYIKEAMNRLDSMTDRERMTTRGYAAWAEGDYEQCKRQYSDVIDKFPADIGSHNQLALCLSNLREMQNAMKEMQFVVKQLPKLSLFRVNLSLYSSYASDFAAAEREARAVEKPDEYTVLALAFAQFGQDRVAEAKATYERLSRMGPLGETYGASGLGDLAAYEGRYDDAVSIFRRGAAADLKAKLLDRAAAKFAAIAFAELSRGRRDAAREAALEALKHSQGVKIRFLVGRTLAEADDEMGARTQMQSLAKELSPEAQAHAKIIEAMLTVKSDARAAMTVLDAAYKMFPTWIGLFESGRAALAAGALNKADAAFDDALKRKGEGLSLFVDEEPTTAYIPLAHYYQGRVREEIPTTGFRNSYRQYVQLRSKSPDDALLPDARRRAQEP
jgi:serine/threonine protein kinase/tetratricopeptide (TPR) repeat protein